MTTDIKALKKEEQTEIQPPFFAVSNFKLIVMTLLTSVWFFCVFSFYEFHWFYTHWWHIKHNQDDSINPLLRSLIPPFFVVPLANFFAKGYGLRSFNVLTIGWGYFYLVAFIFQATTVIFPWFVFTFFRLIMYSYNEFSFGLVIVLFVTCLVVRILALRQLQKQANQMSTKLNPLFQLDETFTRDNKIAIFFSFSPILLGIAYLITFLVFFIVWGDEIMRP